MPSFLNGGLVRITSIGADLVIEPRRSERVIHPAHRRMGAAVSRQVDARLHDHAGRVVRPDEAMIEDFLQRPLFALIIECHQRVDVVLDLMDELDQEAAGTDERITEAECRPAPVVFPQQLFQPALALQVDERHRRREARDLVRRQIGPHATAAFVPATQHHFQRPTRDVTQFEQVKSVGAIGLLVQHGRQGHVVGVGLFQPQVGAVLEDAHFFAINRSVELLQVTTEVERVSDILYGLLPLRSRETRSESLGIKDL